MPQRMLSASIIVLNAELIDVVWQENVPLW